MSLVYQSLNLTKKSAIQLSHTVTFELKDNFKKDQYISVIINKKNKEEKTILQNKKNLLD